MPAIFSADRMRLQISDYFVEETCGKHDLLTIQTPGGSVKLRPYAGKPVSLVISDGGNKRTIAGYLDTQATSAGRDADSLMVGYVLGASSAMRSGQERAWKGKRPFEIARDVVQGYGFCLEMDTYKHTIPLFVQHNESDWQLLSRLADEVGMAVVGTNCVIRIIDPSMEIRRRQLRQMLTYNISKVREYHVSDSPVPVGYEKRVLQGIDRHGQTFTVIANPDSPVSLPAPEIFGALGDALNAKERIERRRHRLWHATAVVPFNPMLRSGQTVRLTNASTSHVWFVMDATHRMMFKSSSTSLVLRRDADGQRGTNNTWRDVKWPTPQIKQGKWVGSQRWEREL